jgi:hypothetical protein
MACWLSKLIFFFNESPRNEEERVNYPNFDSFFIKDLVTIFA